MWEAIASNQKRSWVLISLMGALLVLLGFLIGMVAHTEAGGAIGAVVALGLWLVLFLVAMYQGDSVLLMSSRAHRIEKQDAPRLWNVVEEMCIASGMSKMPAVYVIESDIPNAFAVGRRPEKAAVAVTSGLLRRLDRDELQGVVAHEIGHIKNLDIRFMTIASVMLGAIVLMADVFLRSLWYGGMGRRGSSRGGGQAQAIILVVAIVVAILAPVFAQMLYFACSRRREYLADASAARFTRYPDGLASALEKIALQPAVKKEVSRVLAPLYIVNPLQGGMAAQSLFSTHPPTEKRIKILRSMGGRAGYVDYEAAFKKLNQASCIGIRTLSSEKSVAARGPSEEKGKRQEAVDRVREVTGLLDRMADFIPIACVCGVNIKAPPGLKRDSIPCPRCGRANEIPHAHAAAPGGEAPSSAAPGKPAPSLRYERKGDGWESFKCICGKVIQLSPNFIAPVVTCRKCKRRTEITTPEAVQEPRTS